MIKFFKKLAIFSVIGILLYILFAILILPYLLKIYNGPSTEQQIRQSFENAISKDYDLLILGNSRTYRGINPDKLKIKSYNFSHDADSYNQIYYKLKFLLENGKRIKFLILSCDYFQFSFISSKRNYIYGRLLGESYLSDYEKSNWTLAYYLDMLNPEKLRGLKWNIDLPYLKENGQFIKPGIAKTSDNKKRSIKRLQIQVNYFEKTLKLCKSNKIKVFLIILPLRNEELDNYDQKDLLDFRNFINNYLNETVNFIDFSLDKGYRMKDFTDITHLNSVAADRLSIQLSDSLIKLNVK